MSSTIPSGTAGTALTETDPARDVRRRLARDGLNPIEADPTIAGLLVDDEAVLVRLDAELSRPPSRQTDPGTLHLTTARLIHLGSVATAVALTSIDEMGTSGRRLWVTLGDRPPLTFDLDRAAGLLVEIRWAARKATR